MYFFIKILEQLKENIAGGILLLILLVLNIASWGAAFVVFRGYPSLLGIAFLAYSYGLRHAVDADHIAAIDNVTRKLMQQGQRPILIGSFFSLGHSTIVIFACFAIAATSLQFAHNISWIHSYGATIGTLVSSLFLLLLAFLNWNIFRSVYKVFKKVKLGQAVSDTDLHNHLHSHSGGLSSVYSVVFNLVNKSWQMYFVGFLFGLGFDTATEVGLLGISATSIDSGLPVWSIMMFPLLFVCGMAFIDSFDNIIMVGAYGWAFRKPIRKLYYNMTITITSVLIALVIGGIEGLGLVGSELDLHNGFWGYVELLNENMGYVGYAVIVLFVLCWGISGFNYLCRKYDAL